MKIAAADPKTKGTKGFFAGWNNPKRLLDTEAKVRRYYAQKGHENALPWLPCKPNGVYVLDLDVKRPGQDPYGILTAEAALPDANGCFDIGTSSGGGQNLYKQPAVPLPHFTRPQIGVDSLTNTGIVLACVGSPGRVFRSVEPLTEPPERIQRFIREFYDKTKKGTREWSSPAMAKWNEAEDARHGQLVLQLLATETEGSRWFTMNQIGYPLGILNAFGVPGVLAAYLNAGLASEANGASNGPQMGEWIRSRWKAVSDNRYRQGVIELVEAMAHKFTGDLFEGGTRGVRDHKATIVRTLTLGMAHLGSFDYGFTRSLNNLAQDMSGELQPSTISRTIRELNHDGWINSHIHWAKPPDGDKEDGICYAPARYSAGPKLMEFLLNNVVYLRKGKDEKRERSILSLAARYRARAQAHTHTVWSTAGFGSAGKAIYLALSDGPMTADQLVSATGYCRRTIQDRLAHCRQAGMISANNLILMTENEAAASIELPEREDRRYKARAAVMTKRMRNAEWVFHGADSSKRVSRITGEIVSRMEWQARYRKRRHYLFSKVRVFGRAAPPKSRYPLPKWVCPPPRTSLGGQSSPARPRFGGQKVPYTLNAEQQALSEDLRAAKAASAESAAKPSEPILWPAGRSGSSHRATHRPAERHPVRKALCA